MNSRPPSSDGTNSEQPAAGPEQHESERVARFLRIIGYLLIVLWGLPLLLTLLFFASLLVGGGGGGPGWGGIGVGMAIGVVLTAGITISCTLLPLGVGSLFVARMVRRGGREERVGRRLVLAIALLLAGAGVMSFVRQLLSETPIPYLLIGALCAMGSAIILIVLQPKRGAIAAVVLIVMPVVVTVIDVYREQVTRTRLEAEVIQCDLYLRWGGLAMTSSGDVIVLGCDAKGGRPILQQWDFLSGKYLGEDQLPKEELPQLLGRSQWDVGSHGSILAMPSAKGGAGQGLYVFDFVSKEERVYRHHESYLNDCCDLCLTPQNDYCAVAYEWRGTVNVWDLANGGRRTWCLAENGIKAAKLAFDPRGKFLAIYFDPNIGASKDASHRLGIWSLERSSPELLWCIDVAPIYDMRVSSDATRLIVVTSDLQTNSELLRVAAATGEVVSRHALGGPIDAWEPGWCGLSTAADQLVIVRPSSTEVWDVKTGDCERTLPFGVGWEFGLNRSALHVDQMRLVTAVKEPRYRYGFSFTPPTNSSLPAYWIRRWDLTRVSETVRP